MDRFYWWGLVLAVTLVGWIALAGSSRPVRVAYLLLVLAGLVGTLLMPAMLCGC